MLVVFIGSDLTGNGQREKWERHGADVWGSGIKPPDDCVEDWNPRRHHFMSKFCIYLRREIKKGDDRGFKIICFISFKHQNSRNRTEEWFIWPEIVLWSHLQKHLCCGSLTAIYSLTNAEILVQAAAFSFKTSAWVSSLGVFMVSLFTDGIELDLKEAH